MSDPSHPPRADRSDPPHEEPLGSWKEIAAYLRRDVTTAQRWERREGMPVHRHLHDKGGSVYAFRAELDAWMHSRKTGPAAAEAETDSVAPGLPRRRLAVWLLGALAAAAAVGLVIWQLQGRDESSQNPLAGARFSRLTDFEGIEQAAALSRDGRFVAFLSDRDGRMDVWVTQVGAGHFYNLTKNAAVELVNPSVRTLGFSPDGTLVTFWTRGPGSSTTSEIHIRAAPVLGGASRPYLEGIAEFDWSADGRRLAYHTPGPGDPMFVTDPGQQARQILSAPPGQHAHFPAWSPDAAFIYFVQGALPDRMDIWRMKPDGSGRDRVTHHDSSVSHPVFLDERTLLYLATDADGGGPWLHSLDLEARLPRRIGFGLERYTSLAASADGQRLAATVATVTSTLWRLRLDDGRVASAVPERMSTSTGSGTSPRLGPGFLLYVSPKGESDSIWKLEGEATTELWSAPETRLIGAPAIARGGDRIAFCARQNGRAVLYVMNADGTNARIVMRSQELRGTPAWAPDGASIVVAEPIDGAPRLVSVPLDGGGSSRLVEDHAMDPAWSAEGDLLLYSGADIGTTFPVKGLTRAGRPSPLPNLTLSRGSRHLAFLPGTRSIVVLKGEIGHKNLWVVDLATGADRQLTRFGPEFSVRDFDISPDGRELVLERTQEYSDIVLIQRGPK